MTRKIATASQGGRFSIRTPVSCRIPRIPGGIPRGIPGGAPRDRTVVAAGASSGNDGSSDYGNTIAPETVGVICASLATSLVIALTFNANPATSPQRTFRNAIPAVATVTSMRVTQDPFAPTGVGIERVIGTGTGFFFSFPESHDLSEVPLLLTNAHVVRGSTSVTVAFDDGDVDGQGGAIEYDADVVGVDDERDVAVLRIRQQQPPNSIIVKASIHSPLKKCTKGEPDVGDPVLAIGSPYGLRGSMSLGIVSVKHRAFEQQQQDGSSSAAASPPIVDLIQTDAKVMPGNSGGPLVDARYGCVVGMTTATFYTDVGLAIPAKTAYEAARRIVAGDGPEARALLGITLVDPDLARALLSPNTKGIIVSDALVGGPAQIAGIVGTSRDPATGRPVIGDVILRIDGVPVEDAKDVAEALAFAQKRLLLLASNSPSRSAGSSGSGGEFRFAAKVVVTVQKADGSVRDLRVYFPDAGSAATGK